MRVKYRFPVNGRTRLQFVFNLPVNGTLYELELGEHGQLSYVSAVLPVPDSNMWPTVQPSKQAGISLHINMPNPFFEDVRKNIRSAEGILAFFGVESIDTEKCETSWLPDNPEEKKSLDLYEMKYTRERQSIQSMPYIPFDLVARAFISSQNAHDIEVVLSFFRKGRKDVIEARYIEATIDFLFMLESLYSNGKFKSAQVEEEYLRNTVLQEAINSSLVDEMLRRNISSDERIKHAFLHDYSNKTSADITKHLVALRGFLHHHTKDRKGIWHPEDHFRYGADAYFLQQLCLTIGFTLIDPLLFAPETVRCYQELQHEFAMKRRK